MKYLAFASTLFVLVPAPARADGFIVPSVVGSVTNFDTSSNSFGYEPRARQRRAGLVVLVLSDSSRLKTPQARVPTD